MSTGPSSPPSASLARCQRALDASHDGFWERNLRTQTIWYSPVFLAMFGFGENDLPAERGAATARVHPEDQARFRQAYLEALRDNSRFDYEVRFLDAAGAWRWVHGRGRVWPDDRGQAEYICGSVADVHRRVTALQDLDRHRRDLEALVRERTAGLEAALALAEQRRLDAERANAAKSRFLAQMSHEIRTPLNGVLGLTELALRAAHSAEQRRHLETAWQSGRALQQVISDVLDFSRIESGRIELQQQAFDPAELLAEAFRAAMPLARQRRLLVLFDWTGDEDRLLGDAGSIRQILTNLLGNAIKFTESGQIALVADLSPRPDGRKRLVLAVSDTGPGVPAADRARVFDAFEQADNRLARGHGGTGLGLSIALRLARAMGGTLALDCPADGGSVFTLTLDLPPAPPLDGPSAPPAATPGRAWVVYHRQDAGDWVARRLMRLGWQTQVMVGLPAALAQARHAGALPDMLLLGEPVLDADADLAGLRRHLPEAAMHLLVRPDWQAPALERQAAALRITPLVAPLTPALLRTLGAATPDLPPASPPDPGPAPQLGPAIEVLLVEDNPVNQLVGQAFLQALGLQVRLAGDGRQALAACLERAPALVLMDLQMPGMDGLEATVELLTLQRAGRWPGAPILALTAHATEADRAACHAAGMQAVLTKPLTLEMLRLQLARWLPVDPPAPR